LSYLKACLSSQCHEQHGCEPESFAAFAEGHLYWKFGDAFLDADLQCKRSILILEEI